MTAGCSPTGEDLDLLLANAKSGDRVAFAALIRARQAMVYSIARNFLRNDAHAEDIAQDVFLELYRNLGQIESGSHFVSWLRQVTSRKCIDQTRRSWWRGWVGLDDSQQHQGSSNPTSQDPLLNGRIHRLIGKLPERTRMMIVLRFQEEMEPNEIAETLQVPVGTVKSTIHRGLEQVRRKLGSSGPLSASKREEEECLKTTMI
ncbi:sigma-24 [Bryobacterales bacterium F-183]|nr:sigma-24 [Bryobacterales bacterium F-183]